MRVHQQRAGAPGDWSVVSGCKTGRRRVTCFDKGGDGCSVFCRASSSSAVTLSFLLLPSLPSHLLLLLFPKLRPPIRSASCSFLGAGRIINWSRFVVCFLAVRYVGPPQHTRVSFRSIHVLCWHLDMLFSLRPPSDYLCYFPISPL